MLPRTGTKRTNRRPIFKFGEASREEFRTVRAVLLETSKPPTASSTVRLVFTVSSRVLLVKVNDRAEGTGRFEHVDGDVYDGKCCGVVV